MQAWQDEFFVELDGVAGAASFEPYVPYTMGRSKSSSSAENSTERDRADTF